MPRGKPFMPGQSGNPRGRPKKHRALTEILERAGSKTIELNGARLSGKRLVGALLWDLATTGECVLPGGRDIRLNADEWLDVIKYLYAQIDGPPRQDIGVEHSGEIDIAGYRDELARKLHRIADTNAEDDVSEESDE